MRHIPPERRALEKDPARFAEDVRAWIRGGIWNADALVAVPKIVAYVLENACLEQLAALTADDLGPLLASSAYPAVREAAFHALPFVRRD